MYHREYPIVPTQQAANGAIAIYVAGFRADNARQMLFGLSVLSSATEAQVHAAMSFMQSEWQIPSAEIAAMLAS